MDESQIFDHALKLTNAMERAAFIERVCGGDVRLRADVEALLQAESSDPDFLERPADSLLRTDDRQQESYTPNDQAGKEQPGMVIAGRYKLIEVIGEGGMGSVWMAEQINPVRRLVALKVIKVGMDSKAVLSRFEAERQALALMDHPNIAKVFDAGSTPDGRPFFVMELVKGRPITTYCDELHLPPRERLELFVPVCQAIQHAHQKGIIHRDIKPSNILVALYDDKPVPKVIDFGVAKATGQQLTESTLHTGFGAVVGTVEYMSPEQASFNQLDVDTRSDIYSLGVVLYELLAGSPPFSKKDLQQVGLLEVLRVIREQEPSRPSTKLSTDAGLPTIAANRGTEPKRLAATVRGELDWIVLKALEKQRHRRYETASNFALDVQRYLADETVQACPPSLTYRCRKFAGRNKRALATIAALAIMFLLAVGAVAGSVGWMARDRAARQAKLNDEAETAVQEGIALRERALTLIDSPHQWESTLAAASFACRRAEALARRDDTVLDSELIERIRALGERLKIDEKDRRMVATVERIRMEQSEPNIAENRFSHPEAAPKYRQAFESFGLTIGMLPNDAAALIRSKEPGIQQALISAIDDWFICARKENPDRGWVYAVLAAVDTDSWRKTVRDTISRRDRGALEELAQRDQTVAQPSANLVNLGKALTDLGAAESAVRVLRRAQERFPSDFWINHQLALSLLNCKPRQLEEAIWYFRIALALRPRNAAIYMNYGVALDEKGDLPGAIVACNKAIELEPGYAAAHLNLGHALIQVGDLPGAIAACQKALVLNPTLAMAHNTIGLALKAQGYLPGAIAAYEQAIAIDPNSVDAHNNLGNALTAQGDLPAAIAAFQKALTNNPRLAETYCNLGITLKAKGDLPGAIAAFQNAVIIKPDYAQAHYNLGLALQGQGNRAGAVAAYEKAIAAKPDHAEAHNNLGNAMKANGDLTRAIAHYKKAIACKPNLAEPYHNLAVALRARGDLIGAVAADQKAIAIKPDYARAHLDLGLTLIEQGKFIEARAEAAKAHEFGSKQPGWSAKASASLLAQCDRLIEMDMRLPDYLQRKTKPKSLRERLEFAAVCARKQMYATSTRLYQEAFIAAPEAIYARFDAARAAALASCGLGEEATQLEDKERSRIRQQALDWLWAELTTKKKILDKETTAARDSLQGTLDLWMHHTDLAGVRDPKALAKLPAPEKDAWVKFWSEVDTLLRQVQKERP